MTSTLRWRSVIALTAALIATAGLKPSASIPTIFDGGRLVDAGTREIGLEAGDFNEDGWDDVFTANSNGTADLLLNRTDNWFVNASGFPKSATGANENLVTGDFNGDGHLDAALVARDNGLIRVFLGSGAGGVISSLPYSAGASTQPFDVATADMDGDGDLDLVTANQANTSPLTAPTVTVRLNTGSGGFAGGATYTAGAVGALTRGIAVGDVTGDGTPDVVVVNTNTNEVRILVNNGSGGLTLSPTAYATTNGPRKVVLADLDEDGDLDIATADSGDGVPANPANRNNKTTVLLNDGSGAFTPAAGSPFTTGPVLSAPFALRAHDLDGDGHLDLAFVNRYNGSLSVLFGAGDGTFSDYLLLPYPDDYTDAEATDIVVADVNHDGKPDLIGNAAGSPGYIVPFLNTTPTFDPPELTAVTPASPSNDTGPRVFGTTAGALVKVYETNDCSGTPAATGTATLFTTTGIPVPVTGDGTHTFYATASNAAGWATSDCSGTSVSYTLDTTPPDAPTIDSSFPGSPSYSPTPQLIGTAESGSSLRIYASSDCSGSAAVTGSAAAFASSGLGVSVGLPSSTPFTATARDAAGNTSICSSPFTYTSVCVANPVVTTSSDNPAVPNRLRDAIYEACPGATITFAIDPSPATIFIDGALVLNRDVTIDGGNQVTVWQAARRAPVFSVDSGTVTLKGLTITGAVNGAALGGGVEMTGGSLTIRKSWITGNDASAGAGVGIAGGSVAIIDSTISGNQASEIFGVDGIGAGISRQPTTPGTLTIENTTISGNSATGDGGGIFNDAPGLTIVNSTITNNRSDSDSDGSLTAGGIRSFADDVVLKNTIVAGNTVTGNSPGDLNGHFAGSTFNLIGADVGIAGITNGSDGNQIGTQASPIDARLGPLANNGGPTQTHALLTGSPALDAGDNANTLPSGSTTDQRGFTRVLDGPDADTTQTVDLGAVEQNPTIEDLADRTILEDSATTLSPLQVTIHVGDPSVGDSPGNFESVTATSSNQALVTDANLAVTGTGSTQTLSIVTEPNGSGMATVTVTVRKDVNGTPFYAIDTFVLTVTAVNDPPTLAVIPNQTVAEDSGNHTIQLSGITAGPGESQSLTVFATSSDQSLVPNPSVGYVNGETEAGLLFAPAQDRFGTVTITVFVRDGGGDDNGGVFEFARTFDITVTPVGDPPQVTPASARFNQATTSGLEITRNAVDGSEVQYFRVTNIQNGTLKVTGTSTAVGNGSVLSLAEGAAGLTFTPAPDSTATGSFDVVAQLDAVGNGASAPTSVTVPVNKHTTQTSVTTTPNPSVQLRPVTANFTVSSTTGGPTPTGYVEVHIAGSSEMCGAALDGSGKGSCQFSPADVGVDREVTASYAGDATSDSSVGTTNHTVAACLANPIVANTDDDGSGSLRHAIADACSSSTITFDIPGPGPHTILLGSELVINKSLTVTGSDEGIRIDGNHATRLVRVTLFSTVAKLERLTLVNGTDGLGGAILTSGTLTIADSTLSGNTGTTDGGAIVNLGTLTITGSTLDSNTTSGDGGAIFAGTASPVTIVNSTLSGNHAGHFGGAIYTDVAPTLTHVTITGNSAVSTGGGVYLAGATITNSIIAGNTAPTDPNLNAGLTLLGGNVTSGDPKLGPLQNNGGLTFTHALLANSPALDGGDDAAATAAGVTTDQRGVARSFDGPDADTTATVDIGAFESRASIAFTDTLTLLEGTPGATVTLHLGDPVTLVSATSTVGPLFVPQEPYLSLTGSGATRSLFVAPDYSERFGTQIVDIIVFAVYPGGFEELHAPLTVNILPVADTPTFSNSLAWEDGQTTDGLVVTKSVLDGPEVSHLKIISVANGTLYKHDGVTPIAQGSFIPFADGAAGLRFSPLPNSTALGSVIVQASTSASDAGLGGDPVTAQIYVNSVGDAPQISSVTTLEDTQSGLITVLPNAADAASLPTVFKITGITGGTLSFLGTALHDGDFIARQAGADGLRFTPSPDSIAAGHFTAQAAYSTSDPLSMGAGTTATITVTPVADAPSVTAASTYVNKQTASGLVIARNAVDGAEVTHFKISAVTSGTLYQNDGTTAIADGAFITFAQGNAGLKFTPSSGFIGTAGFQVQGATDGAGGGLSPATAVSIPVDKHVTQTTVTAHTPNPVDRNASLSVSYSVVSLTGGPAPTGTVTVRLGTKSCTGTVAAGHCTFSPNTGGTNQTLTATYNGDAVSQSSTTSVLQDVNACPNLFVTTTADSGPGSLRQAIASSCSVNLILFDIPGAGPHTIVLTSGPLVVNKVIWFYGPLDSRLRISGNHASRVFDVTSAGAQFTGIEIVDGAADEGAGIRTSGGITLDGVLLSGNVATAKGGALLVSASAPYVEIFGSTISGNNAPSGSAAWSDGPLSFVNATVTANTGGGAVVNSHPGSTTANSIIAGNDGPQITNTGAGAVFNLGNSILSGDPKLGPLQDNGGPTFTHMPLPGSPAIDGGDNNLIIPDSSDQRGFERIVDGPDVDAVATVDIGAVEAAPSIELVAPQTIAEDGSGTVTFRLGPSAGTFGSIVATSSDTTLVPNPGISGSGDTRTLTMTPAANRYGTVTITITATSTLPNLATNAFEQVTATSSFVLTVGAVLDPPSATSPTTAEDTQTTIVVTPNAVDGAEVTHFRVSAITNGAVFKSDGVTPVASGGYVTKAEAAALKFTPAANLFSPAASFGFTVQAAMSAAGAGLGPATVAIVTVTPVADTPSVTNASTSLNQQTATGLVITKSAVDGAEVTHYRITNITGGALFQQDGVTPIASGAFVTLAQGAAGLKFTPTTNSATTGHFSVQASIGAAVGGLGGGVVTADITINKLASTTTVATSAPVVNPGQSVTFTATVTPTAAGASGTVQFMDGASTLGSPVTLSAGTASFSISSLASGLHTITAVYSGNTTHSSSTGTLSGGQLVRATVTIGIVSSANPSSIGTSVSLQATLSTAGAGTPTGSLVFAEGATTLTTLPLASGAATFTTSAFAIGVHHLTITYAGDAAFAPASTTFDQTVGSGRAIVTGADAGGGPSVRRFNAIDGGVPASGVLNSFQAFEPLFSGGVRVAEGDVNGDGVPDPIAASGSGRAPEIRVYDGATGALVRSFLAFEPTFTGGVYVAAGDVDGDGYADIVAGSGAGRRGEVKVFSGRDGSVLRDTFVFAASFTGGVRVAAGDVNGDGAADLVAGTGPGTASSVTILSGGDLTVLRTFSPYGGFPGGVFVAAGDVTGDGYADVVTGADAGGGPHVQVFDGVTGGVVLGFFAFDPAFAGGVRVATGDVNGDGKADIVAGAGPGGSPEVRVFDAATGSQLGSQLAYPIGFTGGVFVATVAPQHRMALEMVLRGGGPSVAASGPGGDRRPNTIAGWAFAENPRDAGVSAIHVWAVPVGGGAAIFVGAATLGDARPDVAQRYGQQYGRAGFHLDIGRTLPAGTYDVAVFAQSAQTGTFAIVRFVRATVTP